MFVLGREAEVRKVQMGRKQEGGRKKERREGGWKDDTRERRWWVEYEMAGEGCGTKEEKRKGESGMGKFCRRRQWRGRKAERKRGQGKEIGKRGDIGKRKRGQGRYGR
jgi:hypothetical protein